MINYVKINNGKVEDKKSVNKNKRINSYKNK